MSGTEDVAREYAWNWFQYHAGQRQAVFRFYLILVGISYTGYLAYGNAGKLSTVSWMLGLVLSTLSFLFWRLDERSRDLIRLAEEYLKHDEQALAEALQSDSSPNEKIMFATRADDKEHRKIIRWPFRKFYTFRQVYGWLFGLNFLVGLAIVVCDTSSPVRRAVLSIYWCLRSQ